MTDVTVTIGRGNPTPGELAAVVMVLRALAVGRPGAAQGAPGRPPAPAPGWEPRRGFRDPRSWRPETAR